VRTRAALLAALPVLAALVLPASGQAPPPVLTTLSNRPDMVSGGDVLLEVTVPRGARLASLTLGRRDVTGMVRRSSAGRWRGLVTGLHDGANSLRARTSSGAAATLVVTNHTLHGPVFAGPQVWPWRCDTASHGLAAPRNRWCETRPLVTWSYFNVVTQHFADYDPASPPPAPLVGTTTTDQGRTVPFVVRVERGVMDRGLYTIAVLRDGWNHKLGSPFGGSCNPRHQQESVDTGPNELQPTLFSVLDPAKLGKGFMVAHNNLGNLGSSCNEVVAAESLMMLKEHVVERYGAIRWTIGYGCSGGSMLQHLIAADYPGLLDGVTPACSFPDVWSTVTESEDCHLLQRVFDADPTWTAAQQAAVTGYQTALSCAAFDKLPVNSTRSWLDPTNAAGCGEGFTAYPNGPRCTVQDYQRALLGTDSRGRAHRPYDNVGVTYGLRAYQQGLITAEQLVTLNERVGGDDIDWRPVPERARADLTGLRNAYLGGRVLDGARLRDVPILDLRGSSNQEIHTDYHSWVVRARLDAANGTHANQVIWLSHPLTVDPVSYARSFFVMDEWLARVAADHRRLARAVKVAQDKPAVATDSCWAAGVQVTDMSVCHLVFPSYGDPRTAAGGPLAGGVLACALKPAVRLAGLTDDQWRRWLRVFRSGVCDWGRPGRGAARARPWTSYAAGPPVGDDSGATAAAGLPRRRTTR
jgi:hypothetical protein